MSTDSIHETDSDLAFAIDMAELEALADRVVGVGPHAETLPLDNGRLTEAGFWEWWRRCDVLKPAADGQLTWIPPMFRVPSFEQMWADAGKKKAA